MKEENRGLSLLNDTETRVFDVTGSHGILFFTALVLTNSTVGGTMPYAHF